MVGLQGVHLLERRVGEVTPVSKRGRGDGLKSHRAPFDSGTGDHAFWPRLTVGRLTLNQLILVRFQGPEPKAAEKRKKRVSLRYCEIVQLVGLQILNLAMLVRIKLSQPASVCGPL